MLLSSDIDIVIDQEGGWKLTHDPNDVDGGWTYAGITAKAWSYNGNNIHSYEDMKNWIVQDTKDAHDTVYKIYNVIVDAIDLYPYLTKQQVSVCHLSCAVNIGTPTFHDLLRIKTPKDIKSFLRAWHEHYNKLVKDNAEAWKLWAQHLEDAHNQHTLVIDRDKKPKTLRAEYIDGWFNRVEFFRK